MFCAKCGRQLPEGSSFCPKCGAQIPKRVSHNQTIRHSMSEDFKKINFNIEEIKNAVSIGKILTPGNIISVLGAVLMFISVFQPICVVWTGQNIPMSQLGIAAFMPVIISITGIISILTKKDNLYGITTVVGIGATITIVVLTNMLIGEADKYYMGYASMGTGIFSLIVAESLMFVGLIVREKMRVTE